MYPLNSKQNFEKSGRRELAITPKLERKDCCMAGNGIKKKKLHTISFGVTKYTAVLKPCFNCNNQLKLCDKNNSTAPH